MDTNCSARKSLAPLPAYCYIVRLNGGGNRPGSTHLCVPLYQSYPLALLSWEIIWDRSGIVQGSSEKREGHFARFSCYNRVRQICPLLLADRRTCSVNTLGCSNDALATSNHVILLTSSLFYGHDTLPTFLVRIPRTRRLLCFQTQLFLHCRAACSSAHLFPYPFLLALPPPVKVSLRF